MIADVAFRSLRSRSQLIPVEDLLNRCAGSRMPEVVPELLTTPIAVRVAQACPTEAITTDPKRRSLRSPILIMTSKGLESILWPHPSTPTCCWSLGLLLATWRSQSERPTKQFQRPSWWWPSAHVVVVEEFLHRAMQLWDR